MSFEKAQELSKKDKRILMVQLSSKDCIQCNEVAEKGLSSAVVNNKFSEEKIRAVKYSFADADCDHLTKTNIAPSGPLLLAQLI